MPSKAKTTKPFEKTTEAEAEPTRMFLYAAQLYDAMEAQATDGIYEGKVVDTYQSISISMAHYTSLFNSLKELGCIELLSRGVRGRPTRYRLHGRPDEAAYDARYKSGLTREAKPAIVPLSELEQRVKNIEGRLSGLEVKQMFVEQEKRIVALETSIKKLKGGSK